MRSAYRYCLFLLCFLCSSFNNVRADPRYYLQQGWAELVSDNDAAALQILSMALTEARQERDTLTEAEALLYMGMCSYGTSYTNGLKYARDAIEVYRRLEHRRPLQARLGRSRCLQLISTIYSRQGKYKEAAALSREALDGLSGKPDDSTGTLGLVYNTFGTVFSRLGRADSAAYYYRLSLEEYQATHNRVYLPTAYLKMGEMFLDKGGKAESRNYFLLALALADSTGNRQAKVSALLAMGKWYRQTENNTTAAERYMEQAKTIAAALSDKAFYIAVLEAYVQMKKEAGDYRSAFLYEEELMQIRNTFYDLEKERILKSLETAFRLSEKDRQLALVVKERAVIRLSNYLLWGSIFIVLIVASVFIFFLKDSNKRKRLLLEARELIRITTAEQQRWKEEQMKNDLEYKEAQLSALALQMYQKNELMQELKEKLEQGNALTSPGNEVSKLLNRGLNQDREWADFDTHFEHINKNFYTKLKQHFPGISPNDLKLCALIKLNLSIKEMAGILNISPDSVKTARYRLRKKLRLNTEDNLTDFIINLH